MSLGNAVVEKGIIGTAGTDTLVQLNLLPFLVEMVGLI